MSANTEQRRMSLANWDIPDPGPGGAIPTTRSGVVRIRTAGAEPRTLDLPPRSGIQLTLNMETDGGNCTITVASSYKETSDTTIVLSDPGQFVTLLSMYVSTGTLGWRAVAADPWETIAVTNVVATQGTFPTLFTTNFNLGDGSSSNLVITGYAQGTNIGTAVAVTTDTGIITTQAASANAGDEHSFDITKTGFLKNDLVLISAAYNGTTGLPNVFVSDQADGTHTISVTNVHASGALNGTLEITYWVIHVDSA